MNNNTVSLLTQEQAEQYHRDGYLVVHDVLTDAEIDAFVAYEQEPKPDPWRQNLRHHVDDEHWKALATHPRVTAIAERLLSGRPMTVQTMYLEKKPSGGSAAGGQGVALHQDLHYLPCEPETLMACWMALSDTDAENGGLCVVPGSHHKGLYTTHKNQNAEEHDAWEIEYLMRDQAGTEWTERMYSFEIDGLDRDAIEKLTVPRGAAVFFTGLTIHGSYANRSADRTRRAFAAHYVREGTWLYRADVQDLTPTW